MLNRREFIGTGMGIAVAAARAMALPADKFRWAMSSHMFTPMKPHPEEGIMMAARFGFHGIEPWGNELQLYLKQPPAVSKNRYRRCRLPCVDPGSTRTQRRRVDQPRLQLR